MQQLFSSESVEDLLKRTLRVAVLGPLPPPYGGPEVMTQALVNGLKQRTDLIIRHINTQVSRSLAEKGGKQQLRKSLRAIKQSIQLIALILSFRCDVIYLPLTNSPSFLGFLRDGLLITIGLAFKRKVAIRLHGGYYYYANVTGFKRVLVKALLGRVSLAMVQGQRLTTVFGDLVAPERIAVIPNGMDDQPFARARSRRVNQEETRPSKRILFVGLMCPEKGFRDVIAAATLVPEAEFVFAGEWPSTKDEKEVRAFLKEKGIEERILFAGVVSGEAKYDLFATADVFVFPSYFVYEGHAVSSVEALAAGLPIVCTDHGALNESLKDGWNGYFVLRSDPQAIATRLNQLLEDACLRRMMGKHSRQLYEDRFTLQRFIDSWTQAIKTAMPKSKV